jgi:hypothetical protein
MGGGPVGARHPPMLVGHQAVIASGWIFVAVL